MPGSISLQPVESGEVAERLAQLATAAPVGMVEELGGPEVLTTSELAQAWLTRRAMRRRIVGVPIPGRPGRGFRAG